MLIWRSPELEQVLGVPLDGTMLTEDVLDGLVRDGVREREVLDFKQFGAYAQTTGPRPSWTREQEFAKDVAAFANHRGGLLALGIREQAEVAVELLPETAATPRVLEQRLRQAVLNYSSPPVAVDFVTVTAAAGGFFLLAIVPPSPMAPHAVKADDGGRKALVYPVRDGGDTRWLTEAEIATRYSNRAQRASYLDQARERHVAEGLRALEGTRGAWLYFAATPDSEVPAPLTRAAVNEADRWFYAEQVQGPLMASLGSYGVTVAGPGRVVITSRDASDPRALGVPGTGYAELHTAGSFFAAIPVGEFTDGDPDDLQVGEFTLLDALVALVGTGCRWMARQVGAFGNATAQVGICAPGAEAGREIVLVTNHFGRLQRVVNTRSVPPQVSARLGVDLAATGTHQELLAVVYQAAAALLQHFGVAEPDQLTADGAVVARQWERHRQVENWAMQYGVPIV